MKLKLKIILRDSSLRVLTAHIWDTLSCQQIESLRLYPQGFLICSALYELYAKLGPKVEALALFPTHRTDEEYSLTITRTQALALYCSILTEELTSDENAPTMAVLPMANDSYEANFFNELLGLIHKTFLI